MLFSFILNNNFMEKDINTEQALSFSFLRKPDLKNKNIINIII